ncbi:STAS domain-containing protein [Streptomyces sp. NPDC051987]|uniref:STAS domain-containing protein n=1 Tax=Streptomyces sp. NPDC051987 TaxID=3155808 RepID=UPI00342EEB16
MSPLQITTRSATTGPVLAVLGELDHTTAGQLRDQVTALTLRPGERLVLDLDGMEFCDSSGITALIVARNHALAAGAGIALAAVPAHTLRVLGIVGLDQIFPILPDSQAATGPAAPEPGGSEHA